jgi:extracellular elastinolytic metalloproteinase
MTKAFLRMAVLGLATTSLLNCTDATVDDPAGEDEAQVDADDGRPLTGPSSDAPDSIVRSYLRDRVGGAAEQLTVISQSTSRRGVTHVRFEQSVNDLRVHGAYVKAALSSRGELLQVIHKVATATQLGPKPMVSDASALTTAFIEYGYTTVAQRTRVTGNVAFFDRGRELYREPTVERVAYVERGQLFQGFLVETWSDDNNQLDHTLIGFDGRVVSGERRTQTDRYNVFVEDPFKGAQTIVDGPGAGNVESPVGWLAGGQTTVNVRGNNVRAYLDTDANNVADAGGVAAADEFLTAVDLAQAPSTTSNRAVAVQNLFYLNNIVHDTLYRHGFVEGQGNFQVNNFGNGGAGNDPVNAEAQDGSGTDNANFATPADGSSPRMQMYLWTGASPTALVSIAGQADTGAYQSSFGAALTTTGIAGALAVVNDGVGSGSDGCTASPAGSLTNKIAIVDRGDCDFTVKVKHAQTAGARAVLIVNNVASGASSPGGTDRKVTIPSAMVTLNDGAALKAQAGVSATLKRNPTPAMMVDASLDADIVAHEYGHGLTWRMIGSMSGPVSGAVGEGASDVNAFLLDGDPVIAEYSASNDAGIRRHSYENYPLTYAAVTGGSVHEDGEIYAAAMWKVRANYFAAGLTNDDVYGDWVEGLSFTVAAPKMENMRDGMLQAVVGTGRECHVWRGFAALGIGVGAKATLKGSRVTITQSFVLPLNCQ